VATSAERKGLKNSIVVASFNSIIVLFFMIKRIEKNIEKESVKRVKERRKVWWCDLFKSFSIFSEIFSVRVFFYLSIFSEHLTCMHLKPRVTARYVTHGSDKLRLGYQCVQCHASKQRYVRVANFTSDIQQHEQYYHRFNNNITLCTGIDKDKPTWWV